MVYTICRGLCLIILKIFCRMRVCGKENIPQKGGFLLASNHTSYLDPVIISCVCRRKLNFMAKEELFSRPLFSRFLYLLGIFPVKRGTADLSALKEAMRRLKEGKGLVLFPEGSRNPGGEPIAPQPGVGFLAAKINVPVIPVFIQGSEQALPRGAKFLKPTMIRVFFGKEIPIERRMPYQDTASDIMANIRRLSCIQLN